MKKDPTEFRKRFKDWKSGKDVYDAGRPILSYEDGKDDLPEGFLFDTEMPELTVYGDVKRARRQNNWLTRRGLFPRFYSLGNGQGVKEIKTPTEKGLEIVSPEFYVLGGLRPGGDIVAPITKNQLKSIGNSIANRLPHWTPIIPENPNMAYRRMGPLERDWLMEGNELSARVTNPLTEVEEKAARESSKKVNRGFSLYKAGAEHGGRKQFAKGQPWRGTTVTHGEEQVLAIPGEGLPWVSGKHYRGPQGYSFKVGEVPFEEAPFGSHIDLLTKDGYTGVNPSLLDNSVIYSPFKIFGRKFGYKKLYPGYEGGKDEDDITTLRELTVTPNGSYAMTSSDDMYRNLQYNITRAQYENNLNAYNLLRNINAAQEAGAATIGGALASIVGDPLGYGLIKGGASLLNAAKNLPLFARRVWNGGNIIQRNIPISPKNYYRTIIGNDALNDAFNTGIIRGSKSFNGAPYFSHNGLIVLPAGKHAYVIEGTPSTPVQWTGAYQFRVPSKLRPNGSYIPIERIQNASPKSMLPVSEDILTEAIPWSNGSYQVPTTGFTYWLKHPIIGWRNHSFASRGNTPYASQWDLANAYADAKAYADSPLRVQLFELLKKEAADAGYISLNSLLLLGRMHSRKPQIKFEDLGPDVLGKYLSDKHQIQLNVTDPNPLTPYHEYLHSLDVGRPFKDSFTLTKKYKQLKRRATKFGDQEAAKEVMRYSDDAYGMDDFYTHKANLIIESSADPYYKDPLEMDAYGLEEGKRLFMPTFSPKPSDEVLQRMFQQSLNGPYGHFFKHLKVGDNTLNTYWKLLSGLFLPFGIGGAYIMNQNYKNGKDSGIYIKPENRGKFTALKKRTGHSASWFKVHGTPALKKMATFALNACKWKH